jgi:hypothetical protein
MVRPRFSPHLIGPEPQERALAPKTPSSLKDGKAGEVSTCERHTSEFLCSSANQAEPPRAIPCLDGSPDTHRLAEQPTRDDLTWLRGSRHGETCPGFARVKSLYFTRSSLAT